MQVYTMHKDGGRWEPLINSCRAFLLRSMEGLRNLLRSGSRLQRRAEVRQDDSDLKMQVLPEMFK